MLHGDVSAETFGQLLRAHRMRAGLSQHELARQGGVDAAYISRLERGLTTAKSGRVHLPGRVHILAMAEVFDISQAETDRLLYAAGLAPQADWQSRAEVAEGRLEMIRQTFNAPAELLIFRRMTG